MRIMASGDWHLDLAPRGVDRFDDLRGQVQRVYAKLAEQEPDMFVHLGDVTDPDSGHRTVRAITVMREFYRGVPCLKRQLAGNHDVIDDANYLNYRSSVGPLRDEDVHVIEEPELEIVKGKSGKVGLLFLPYLSGAHVVPGPDGSRMSAREWLEVSTRKALEQAELDSVPVYAFVHLDVDGAVTGSEERMLRGGRLQVPEILETDPRVKLIVGGHIHKAQRVREKIRIVGSFERLDFGERDDEKGLLLVEV